MATQIWTQQADTLQILKNTNDTCRRTGFRHDMIP